MLYYIHLLQYAFPQDEAQQKIAEERFLKIQKAYETFETHLN